MVVNLGVAVCWAVCFSWWVAGYGVVALVVMVGRVRGGAGSSVGGEQTVGAGQAETMRKGINSFYYCCSKKLFYFPFCFCKNNISCYQVIGYIVSKILK